MAILRFSSFLICLIAAFSISSSQLAAINHEGFTTNLIHRDSPLSPSYNPSLTKWDRVQTTLHRSMTRMNLFRLSSSPDDFQSHVIPAMGEHIMEVSLGTPPVSQLAIADTGSDLIWIQCQPCVQCYHQKLPIFDPRKSSSYKVESCDSDACQELSSRSTCTQRNTCKYSYAYGDQSQTEGDLATETLTFGTTKGSKASFPKVSLGCGHNNQGTFREDGSGLIGLGGGPLSLVSQLTSSAGGKFSYCLIPFLQEGNFSSKISFGQAAEVSGRGVVSTPLVKKSPDTFYFLTLEGLTVGDDNETSTFVSFKRSSTNDFSRDQTEEGNIIIDSGTTLTMLPSDMFSELNSALAEKIQGTQVDDPSGVLQLCYQSNGAKDLNIPTITAQFSGAKIELNPVNTFIQVAEEVVCLAMVPADQIAIWGNIAQSNFLVGYDLEGGKID
ncbi:hypothetical protein Cgig2_013751 [Carnegiea gigantea]|uniref:Peptidase A1 domain-containing protein n=1 Tax=Carnegiea gigantea TaxID=171969 RepID=A0A9Q1QFK1_9CARY|nr:hypothetical protein Cgig2_013751 [Carnegiea gigantea]